MKPIRILNNQLELLAEIDDYESLIFISRFHKVGEFEFRININKKHTEKLIKNNIIILGGSKHRAGIIKHRQIELNEDGEEQWFIKGYSLQYIASQRITVPPADTSHDRKSGNAETVMKHYIDNHFINPVDLYRKIDLLSLSPNLNRGTQLSLQSRYKNIAEELELISISSGLGWDMKINTSTKKIDFDVIEGKDLTTNQSNNPPVIFSVDFDNIQSAEYVDSDLNYKNVAYSAGQGEGVDRRVIEVGTGIGLDRIETFIDARDVNEVDENEVPIPEAEIIVQLTERAEQDLLEFSNESTFEAKILTNGPFVYEEDWNLGDIVTVQNRKWGVTLNSRITEVKEVLEPSGYQLEATFGQSRPTLIDRIKQELKQTSAEVRK